MSIFLLLSWIMLLEGFSMSMFGDGLTMTTLLAARGIALNSVLKFLKMAIWLVFGHTENSMAPIVIAIVHHPHIDNSITLVNI